MFRMLFVCTANVCRSPMAEVIAEDMVKKSHMEEQVEVGSCGTWGIEGQPASSLAVMVAKENGLDLSAHRSQPVSLDQIKNADILLCMTSAHKRDLVQIFPHFESKIFLLKEYGRKNPPPNPAVADPIGMNLNFYRQIFREISDEINRVWPLVTKEVKHEMEINN